MSCKCSKYDMDEGYKCSVTGERCVFMIPNSKACAEVYGEGPDADSKEVELELEDFHEVEDEEAMECEYCGEIIEDNEPIYQVKIYEKDGTLSFLKVCSERCAEVAKNKSYEIHKNMADNVKNQEIQKLR
jgi:ribosomal protein L24E